MEREAVIRDYHRQNMYLAVHPLVDIVAHPWWWHGHWENAQGRYVAEPWFDDFNCIPRSMHQEFAAAAVENNIKVEINMLANLLNGKYPEKFKRQYLEYLAELKEQGVTFSIGSDCHHSHYRVPFDRAAKMLASIEITKENLWRL
jgi:histidinol phosphatase-like PHP family hydrolase